MKATLKRALSVLCALALCIGLLPVSALAADENTQNEYVQFDYGSPITGSGARWRRKAQTIISSLSIAMVRKQSALT